MSTQPNATSNARQHMSALHQIGYILGEINDFEDALNRILEDCVSGRAQHELSYVELATRRIRSSHDRHSIRPFKERNGDEDATKSAKGLLGKVVESGKAVIVPRISSEPLFLNRTGAHGNERSRPLLSACPSPSARSRRHNQRRHAL